MSFLFVAVACGFAALCYSEFASMVPVSGSAYTYAYATLGELVAWIIGWDLILEYAVGNVAVAISWSDYFQSLLAGFKVVWPVWLGTDYRSALQAAHKLAEAKAAGVDLSTLSDAVARGSQAWQPGAAHCGHSDHLQPAGRAHRGIDHLGAGPGHSRERGLQLGHGDPEAGHHRVLPRRRRLLRQAGELDAVCAQRAGRHLQRRGDHLLRLHRL